MSLFRKDNSRKGAAMIWVISFGLAIFTLGGLLLTMMMTSTYSFKSIRQQQENKINLNQVGEYFLRSVECGGEFPVGTETTDPEYDKFGWMDSETREFFKDLIINKHYTFEVTSITENGDF